MQSQSLNEDWDDHDLDTERMISYKVLYAARRGWFKTLWEIRSLDVTPEIERG